MVKHDQHHKLWLISPMWPVGVIDLYATRTLIWIASTCGNNPSNWGQETRYLVTLDNNIPSISWYFFIAPKFYTLTLLTPCLFITDTVWDCQSWSHHNLRNTCRPYPRDIESLYQEGLFTDVNIICEDKKFKVHKAILASQSPVLKKMVMKEIVKLTDISPAAVSDLVTYLYTSSAPNVGSLTTELFDAANRYELPRLLLQCQRELV